MARFEEIIKGLVDAQVRGTQVQTSDLESSRAREREELNGEQHNEIGLPQIKV